MHIYYVVIYTGICDSYDTIVKVITEVPEDTTKLVKLIKYVEDLDGKDFLVIKVSVYSHQGVSSPHSMYMYSAVSTYL